MHSPLARFAECAFWLARYMERAENLARILDVNETFARRHEALAEWTPILEINADQDRFLGADETPTVRSVIAFYVLDRDNPTSIIAAVRAARENARMIRHLISTEMWTQLNVFYNTIAALGPVDVEPAKLSRVCRMIKEGCQTHDGITDGTLYYDQFRCFYQIGKYIERADQTSRLLDMKYRRLLPPGRDVDDPVDAGEWNAVLRSVAGYHAFRRVHPRGLRPATVAGFLLYNDSFPRAVALCLGRIETQFGWLESHEGLAIGPDIGRVMAELETALEGRNLEVAASSGLHRDMDWIQLRLIALTNALGARFFGHDM